LPAQTQDGACGRDGRQQQQDELCDCEAMCLSGRCSEPRHRECSSAGDRRQRGRTPGQRWQSPIQVATPSWRIVARTGSARPSQRGRWRARRRTGGGLRRRAGVDEVLKRHLAVLRKSAAPSADEDGPTAAGW